MHTPTASPRSEAAARVRSEGPIALEQAALVFPAPRHRSKPLHWRTLERWCISGKAGVRLDGCRVSGKWHTSLAAVLRFRKALGLERPSPTTPDRAAPD